jgi:hypothetical protein
MGFKNVLNGLFSSKKKEEEKEIVLPTSFNDLKVGNGFSIDICDVMDMCGMTFDIKEEFKYVVSMDHTPQKVLTISAVGSNENYRATEMSLSGTDYIRIDKLLTDDEVLALFENNDEEDFKKIFSDDVKASFKLKRFALGDESLVKPLLDWSAESYKFAGNMGIEGYIEKNGYQEAIQYYFLFSPENDYAFIVENYEDGVAKIYLSHLLAPSNLSSYT